MAVDYLEEMTDGDWQFPSLVAEAAGDGNREMNLAWQFVTCTDVSVFLTGKAGTGKTTFLRTLRERTPKRMVVLAPTGVAAINAQGQTIHSFFQLPFGPAVPGMQTGERRFRMGKEKKNLIRTLDLLVIDEISMVRCDVLDAVDQELRRYRDRSRPFGGVQLLLIGDLQQLAPVAQEREWSLLAPYYDTPYFFGSKALAQVRYVTVELRRIYRQQDETFIDILGKIRGNRIDDAVLRALNARYVPDFEPPNDEDWIRLTTHNRMANLYNEQMLNALPAKELRFRAEVYRNFPESSYPADETLVVKEGAQVMFIKNDPNPGKEYYNGKIGVVKRVVWDDDEGQTFIVVHCKEDGRAVYVPQLVWENTKYVIDDETKEIREEVEGTFTQFPLRLAWAITVHKSQGLTFDRAVLDINESFTHGQVYVALSRCRTLGGMVLARPLSMRSVITDSSVNAYIDRELEEARLAQGRLPQMMFDYYFTLLNEMFDFQQLKSDTLYLHRVVNEHLYASYPDYLSALQSVLSDLDADVLSVSRKFQSQYIALMQQSGLAFARNEKLQERLKAAMVYFDQKLHELFDPVVAYSRVAINNKQVVKQYNNALDAFLLSLKLKLGIFSRLHQVGFTVRDFLDAKAKAALDDSVFSSASEAAAKSSRSSASKSANRSSASKSANSSPASKSANSSPASKSANRYSAIAQGNEPKKAKVDTKRQTFRLFAAGKTVKEIAAERSLTVGTIENHLAYFVEQGEIDINEVVSSQHQKIIRGIVRSFDKAYTLSEVKNLLPSEYTYMEIKLVIADMKRGL